jgi:hypothetical protein
VITIGIDPHKSSLTAVTVDASGDSIGQRRFVLNAGTFRHLMNLLPFKHSELVTEQQDLRVLPALLPASQPQPREHTDDDEIDEPRAHDRPSCSPPGRTPPLPRTDPYQCRSHHADKVFDTHTRLASHQYRPDAGRQGPSSDVNLISSSADQTTTNRYDPLSVVQRSS